MMAAMDVDAAPLVIDLDGTLVRTDLLHESVLKMVRRAPYLVFALPYWLMAGRAAFKRRVAEHVSPDYDSLPYDPEVLAWIREEREHGRRVVLCTASDSAYAEGVASHLGLFDEVFASDGTTNLSSGRKAALLVDRYGDHGFDYAGNSSADLEVWRDSRRAILVDTSASLGDVARRRFEVEREFAREVPLLSTWLRAMRPYQWLKNLLVFVPLAGAHQLNNPALLWQAMLAFLAFSLCASSVYIVNDLIDVESDRNHPRKRLRPFASGALAPAHGIVVAAVLLVAATAIATSVTPGFLFWLEAYFALTLAYTFDLKRRPLVDCVALGGLYTLRIVAGWSAVGLPASFWLLAFSLFLFLSLAFVKRYSELTAIIREGRAEAQGRGYVAFDLQLVQTMGVAAGFNAVLLMALYINGDTVLRLYRRPEVLWLAIPVVLYWISRMWMKAHRGDMQEDPLLYSLRDRYSLACVAICAVIAWAAS
jgi:4-hydroxybenzoate polyprenyltransferase/phosphoserine phosphatase